MRELYQEERGLSEVKSRLATVESRMTVFENRLDSLEVRSDETRALVQTVQEESLEAGKRANTLENELSDVKGKIKIMEKGNLSDRVFLLLTILCVTAVLGTILKILGI